MKRNHFIFAIAMLVVAVAGALVDPAPAHAFLANSVPLDLDSTLLGAIAFGGIMSPSQARVIDPILTNLAQGYKNNDMIGEHLFPVVPVDQRGGKIIQFGKEAFRLYNTARAPGSNTKRIQYGYAGANYALEQHALEGTVPFENMQEANAVPGIDLGQGAVMMVQDVIALRNEYAQAAIARDANNYDANHKVTLSGSDQWSHADSDPAGDITDSIEAIRSTIGRRPNLVALPAAVYGKVKQHAQVLDRIKHTGRDSATPQLLAQLWDVKQVVVGDAVYADASDDLVDVWGKDVIIAFTQMGTLRDKGLPSYGYTYRLRNHPVVESAYQDRNAKSWIYPVTDELSPVLASGLAGFLIKDAVA